MGVDARPPRPAGPRRGGAWPLSLEARTARDARRLCSSTAAARALGSNKLIKIKAPVLRVGGNAGVVALTVWKM